MKHLFYKIPSAFFTLFLLAFNLCAQTERDKGIEFYKKGDYKTASEVLQKAVEADANDGEAWRFLGMAFARTNNRKEARKAFVNANKFRDEDLNESYEKPLKITAKRFPRYTTAARNNNVEGNIKLAVEFLSDGKIGVIFPINELSDGLTDSAVEAAKGLKFTPAVKNGKAVTVVKLIEYSFTIY